MEKKFTMITSDPAILGGKPTIKGTRISVELILDLFASGRTTEKICQEYPHLSAQSIKEALEFSRFLVSQEEFTYA